MIRNLRAKKNQRRVRQIRKSLTTKIILNRKMKSHPKNLKPRAPKRREMSKLMPKYKTKLRKKRRMWFQKIQRRQTQLKS